MNDKPQPPDPSPPVRLRTRRPCPLCQQPSRQKYHPFCSARCADVDLHRWLGGHYAIPAANVPDFDETGETLIDDQEGNEKPE